MGTPVLDRKRLSLAAILLLLAAFVAVFAAAKPAAAATGGYPDAGATTVNASLYEWGYKCGGSGQSGCITNWWDTIPGDPSGQKYNLLSPRGYAYRNCTDYVAWKLGDANGFTATSGWGNGYQWGTRAATAGYTVDMNPAKGAVAWYNSNAFGMSSYGHVAYVDSVNADGTVNLSEYNNPADGGYHTRTINASQVSGYIHFKDITSGGTGGSLASMRSTTSTEDSEFGGDFNGDSYNDTLIVHETSDGGADIHVLYGGIGTAMFANSTTWLRSLPASDGWDWTKMKLAVGYFNSDSYADLAIVHQRTDGGADIHVLYGGSTPFTNSTTFVRSLPGTSGWNWSQMKVVSGDFNGDGYDDLAIVHQLGDGGANVYTLNGGIGTAMFANDLSAPVRNLPASSEWNWNEMKLAAGPFNGDQNADLVIVHQRTDGGADVHILNGGATPFQNTSTFLRSLPGTSGWNWSQMKLAAGFFNSDSYADIAILHQRTDGGADVHMLYGNANPFQDSTTYVTSLPGTSGWNWSQMKLAAGPFNSDSYADLAIFHELGDNGMNLYALYGGVGTAMFANDLSAPVRNLPASSGWNWTLAKIA